MKSVRVEECGTGGFLLIFTFEFEIRRVLELAGAAVKREL